MRRLFAGLFFLLLAAPTLAAPHVAVRLVPETLAVAPGGTVTVALEQVIEPGWHSYWSNPGDAGLPTEIAWHLPPGWKAGAIQWPYPLRQPIGPLMDYGYQDKVRLLVNLIAPNHAAPGSRIGIGADVTWLACKNMCVPEAAKLDLVLFVEANPAPPDAVTAESFAAARAKLPGKSPWPMRYAADKNLRLYIEAPRLGAKTTVAAQFFPASGGIIRDAEPQRFAALPGGLVLTLAKAEKFAVGKPLDGVAVLTSQDGSVRPLIVHAMPGTVPAAALSAEKKNDFGPPSAVLFAFLGGLILNIMPCVLPVLAMKALSLAGQAGSERRKARVAAFAYSFGAVASFVAFGAGLAALRAGGEAIGWGFQLQFPPMVAALALLLFAVGLNFLGVFAIAPVSAGDALTRKPGLAGAFFTGVLAVAVAAPCTAPFMATAIGFGLTQGPAMILGVFVALGLGFALPFLMIGLFPSLYRLLPKPGRWMVWFERLMALPMFGAAAWLLWVLARQVSQADMWLMAAALLSFAVALWAWDRLRWTGPVLVGMAAVLVTIGTLKPAPIPAWGGALSVAAEPYSAARLQHLRDERRPVFVDASAAWCITCLVNEKTALMRPKVRAAFEKRNIAWLVADWTNRDPAITALLEVNGRSGVPMYLYYRPGAAAAKVLPQLLTEGIVLKAIEKP
jgi:thiol:disulfide interchange protein